MLNNYDLQMGLTDITPVGFLISAGIVIFLGWLVTKK